MNENAAFIHWQKETLKDRTATIYDQIAFCDGYKAGLAEGERRAKKEMQATIAKWEDSWACKDKCLGDMGAY